MRGDAREFSTPAGPVETSPIASQTAKLILLLHEDPLAFAALHLSPQGLDQVGVNGHGLRHLSPRKIPSTLYSNDLRKS